MDIKINKIKPELTKDQRNDEILTKMSARIWVLAIMTNRKVKTLGRLCSRLFFSGFGFCCFFYCLPKSEENFCVRFLHFRPCRAILGCTIADSMSGRNTSVTRCPLNHFLSCFKPLLRAIWQHASSGLKSAKNH